MQWRQCTALDCTAVERPLIMNNIIDLSLLPLWFWSGELLSLWYLLIIRAHNHPYTHITNITHTPGLYRELFSSSFFFFFFCFLFSFLDGFIFYFLLFTQNFFQFFIKSYLENKNMKIIINYLDSIGMEINV